MIRRVIIFTIAVTGPSAAICLLSYVWQFGYVGSWFSVGMREGTLWYVWRSVPIADGPGFYSDAASAVNRAMYHINGDARFDDEPAWEWVIGFSAFSGYVLLLIAVFRIRRCSASRWATIVLLGATLLSAATWLSSQFGTLQYNGSRVVFSVSDGTLSAYATRDQLPSRIGLTGADGWYVGQHPPALRMNPGQWLSMSSGTFFLNLPIAILNAVFLPPAILCALSRKRKPGHCRHCSYDLTGNQSGICPECGRAIDETSTRR